MASICEKEEIVLFNLIKPIPSFQTVVPGMYFLENWLVSSLFRENILIWGMVTNSLFRETAHCLLVAWLKINMPSYQKKEYGK